MGKAKRKEEAMKKGIEQVVVEVRGVVQGNALSGVRVSCRQTGNWLAIATLLNAGLSVAIQEHTKQLFEAGRNRIAKPTDRDIARLS